MACAQAMSGGVVGCRAHRLWKGKHCDGGREGTVPYAQAMTGKGEEGEKRKVAGVRTGCGRRKQERASRVQAMKGEGKRACHAHWL